MAHVLLNDRANPDARIAEEEHFHKLFEEVLDYMKDEYSIDDREIREAIDRLILSFRYDLGNKFSDIDLTKPDNVCGYLYRYGIHGAGLMRHKTLQAFHNCPDLRRALRKPELRVVSLGGGPGNDVVGFLSALHELGLRGCDMKVTVVDAVAQWGQCVRMVKHFARVGNFGSVSELFRCNSVDLQFVQGTFPHPYEDDWECVVGYADVVIMSKVISVLDWEEKEAVGEYLYHVLKKSALILLVDCPFEHRLWQDFEELYLSREGEAYELHPVEYHSNPYFDELKPVTSKSRIAVLRKK